MSLNVMSPILSVISIVIVSIVIVSIAIVSIAIISKVVISIVIVPHKYYTKGSESAHRTEPKSCLGYVFNFKLACFCYYCNFME